MGTLLAAIALVVGLLLFWLGIKKVRTNSYAWAVVSFLDVAVLVTATVMLRWIGLTLFILVNALALVVTCIRLAARKEELLVYAATQFDIDKAVAYQLNNAVSRSHRIWRYIGPINRAEFIAEASQRGRTPEEAFDMLTPVALLWSNDRRRMSIPNIVGQFDRVLRVWGKSASEAMEVADTLTVAARRSATTFPDVLDGLISRKQ